MLRAATLLCAAVVATATLSAPARADEVRFVINDAHVRDKPVPEVRILVAAEPGGEAVATAETDSAGSASLDLAPGTYWVSYGRVGYVPIGDSETEIRGAGQVITTTLSMLLEAEGSSAGRRIRVVLNWGSEETQVRDADGHVYCVCDQSDVHVYFAAMRHENRGHVVELDVDDRDWGGPETVTLSDPVPGAYRYWVHQYSRDEDTLGRSDVVVRVFFDDSLEGEFRIPADLDGRIWKPFREITVDASLEPRLVRWVPIELASGADREPPPDDLSEQASDEGLASLGRGCVGLVLGLGFVLFAVGLVFRRLRR